MFTDIEGSTRLVQDFGERFPQLLETHDALVRTHITAHSGTVIRTAGDSFFAVFSLAADAIAASAVIQRSIGSHVWPETGRISVRIGVHTGTGTLGGDDYVGLDVHRAARVSDAGHGGQIVVSESTVLLVERHLGEGISFKDLGKHRLKDLSEPESLFQVVAPGIETEFEPLRTLDRVPNNLPAQLTSFIGRERVLQEATNLLERTRILTLTGPGGTGKTRLSLQLGANSSEQFSDGVYFVDLSPVLDIEQVPSAILASAGLRASGQDKTPQEHLIARMSGKNVLLILDNFEQLLAAASVVAEMARAAPESKFLITSRAPLKISGEQEMPIPPLQVDSDMSATSEAVMLFTERAMAVSPSFTLDDNNLSDVVALVGRLDGLPLAIELVASRIKLLPVSTIVDRLSSIMLGSGSVDLPDRQRTIAGAIAWSYQLLTSQQRSLFERLAVFAGGARLEEIERICDDSELSVHVLDSLSDLVDHSLIRVTTVGPATRFRMLFVIQEFASARLDANQDADAFRHRHLETYTEFVESLEPKFLTSERRAAFDAIEAEHDNIRAALDWGMGRHVDLVLRLAAACWRFWQTRGHLYEAQRRIEEVLEQPGGGDRFRARALEGLGGVFWWRGDLEAAASAYTGALDLTRTLGNPNDTANALYNLGLAKGFNLGVDDAIPLFDEAEAIYRGSGDINGLADISWGRGNLMTFSSDFAGALRYLSTSADLYKQSGNEYGQGWAMFEVGGCALRMDDPETAWSYARDGLELFDRHKDVSSVILLLTLMAGIANALEDPIRTHRLAGAFHGLRISTGTDLATIDFNTIGGFEFETLEALVPGELRAAYEEGKAMNYSAAVRYALAGPVDS